MQRSLLGNVCMRSRHCMAHLVHTCFCGACTNRERFGRTHVHGSGLLRGCTTFGE